MMNNDLISVVVPVYNVEAHLNRCVDSIISQTYKNLEIIIIDDGSTDKSAQICDEYLEVDQRITVVHQVNKGLSNARNEGIRRSKGKYISFVDSDDYLDSRFIEVLYMTMITQKADIVVCDIRSFDAYTLQFFPHTRELYNGFVDTDQIFDIMMEVDYPWIYTMTCNKLYARKLFDKASFPDGLIHEDEIIFLDYVKQDAKFYQIKEPLFCYGRGREGSIINKKYSIKRLDILNAFYDRIEWFKQKRNRKLINNERIKIFRKIEKALYKLSFEDIEEISMYQKILQKAAKKCVRNFTCLKMYFSILFSKRYFSICQTKRKALLKYKE